MNNPIMRLQHSAFQVYFMRLVRAQQSEAQFFFKTALQESEVLMTHGYNIAIHNEFLLSLRAVIRSLNGRSSPLERGLLSLSC